MLVNLSVNEMSDRCMWCGYDIMDHSKTNVFLGKWLHGKCWDKFVKEFKKHYGIDLKHPRFAEFINDIKDRLAK